MTMFYRTEIIHHAASRVVKN